jgi:hypothetical protein
MLLKIEGTYTEPDQQFGFRSNSSTNHAIFALEETIKYYKKRQKPIFACAIDASKAFDKVNRERLMKSLYGKVDEEVWLIIRKYYSESFAYVQNQNEISSLFKTSIGVKQGGPLSPKLFSIYMHELIDLMLYDNTLLANINGIKTGIILYADDIILITENLNKMKKALKICEDFGETNEIKWNPSKTQIICFNKKKNTKLEKIELCGKSVEWVNSIKYLGITMNDKLSHKEYLHTKRMATLRTYHFVKKVGLETKEMSHRLKSHLFKCYVRPMLYYGIENIYLHKNEINKMQTLESQLIKKMLGVEKRTRSTQLLNSVGVEPVVEKLKVIKLGFVKRLFKNKLSSQIFEYLKSSERENKFIVEIGCILTEMGTEINAITPEKMNDLIVKKKREINKAKKNGISESIEYCLDNRNPITEQSLKLLVKAYDIKSDQ